MSDFIERQAVRKEIQISFNLGAFSWSDGQALMDRITALPTIPVVRCKECKYFDKSDHWATPSGMYFNCKHWEHEDIALVKEYDFCSKGEKQT